MTNFKKQLCIATMFACATYSAVGYASTTRELGFEAEMHLGPVICAFGAVLFTFDCIRDIIREELGQEDDDDEGT